MNKQRDPAKHYLGGFFVGMLFIGLIPTGPFGAFLYPLCCGVTSAILNRLLTWSKEPP